MNRWRYFEAKIFLLEERWHFRRESFIFILLHLKNWRVERLYFQMKIFLIFVGFYFFTAHINIPLEVIFFDILTISGRYIRLKLKSLFGIISFPLGISKNSLLYWILLHCKIMRYTSWDWGEWEVVDAINFLRIVKKGVLTAPTYVKFNSS